MLGLIKTLESPSRVIPLIPPPPPRKNNQLDGINKIVRVINSTSNIFNILVYTINNKSRNISDI